MARLEAQKNKSRPEDRAAFCQGVGLGSLKLAGKCLVYHESYPVSYPVERFAQPGLRGEVSGEISVGDSKVGSLLGLLGRQEAHGQRSAG